MSIGEVDAENDSKFLKECFVETGDYDVLEDISTSECMSLAGQDRGRVHFLNA